MYPWGVHLCTLGFLWYIYTFTNSFLAPIVKWYELCPGRWVKRKVLEIAPSTDATGVGRALIKWNGTSTSMASHLDHHACPYPTTTSWFFLARHYNRVGVAKMKWILFPILKFLNCWERSHWMCSPKWNGDLNFESGFGLCQIEVYISRGMVDSFQ